MLSWNVAGLIWLATIVGTPGEDPAPPETPRPTPPAPGGFEVADPPPAPVEGPDDGADSVDSSEEAGILPPGEEGREEANAPEGDLGSEGDPSSDDDLLSFDDIVVTPTGGREIDAFETSLPMNLLDPKTLRRKMPMSMDSIFSEEPGVDASTTGPGSVRPMIRGLLDERVLILVDGMRLSEQRPGGNHILSLDPAQIERIEIVRGPTSVLYGSDAIGGVMQIFTRGADEIRADGFRLGLEQDLQVDSAGSGWKSATHLRFGQGPFNGFAGGLYRRSQDIETPSGPLHESFYDGSTVWGGGHWIGEGWKVRAGYYHMNADIGIPAPAVFKKDRFIDEQHHMLNLAFVKEEISPLVPETSVKFAFQRHERHRFRQRGRTDAAGDPLADLLVDIWLDINTYIVDPRVVLEPNDWNTVTVGLQAFLEDATSDRAIRATDGSISNPFDGVPVIPDSGRVGAGLYAQDEMEITERFTLTPGLRFDWIGSESDGHPRHAVSSRETADDFALSGNFGGLFRVHESVNLFANAGRAFRAPTLLERFFIGPHDVGNDIGNPDLDPEQSWNFDAGVKVRHQWVEGTAAGFYNRIEDYIVKTLVPGTTDYRWTNISDAELYGAELGLNALLPEGLTAFTTVSWVRGEDESTGAELPDIPPWQGRFGLRIERELDDEKEVWGEVSCPWATRQDYPGPGEKETPGWMLLDLRVGIDLESRWSLLFAVENVLDHLYNRHLSRSWQAFNLDSQPGRNFKVALRVKF